MQTQRAGGWQALSRTLTACAYFSGMFDPTDSAFLANPYPALNALRERSAVYHDEQLGRWFITRHADVRACLRDRRLGRADSGENADSSHPLGMTDTSLGMTAFHDVERWSLLFMEPPDHTRIRKLVASAFTPRSVEALREPARVLAEALIQPLVERGEFELLTEFAQPFSIGLICHMLGVPTGREHDLLDWSHRMVKMYEFNVSADAAIAANDAADAFRTYVLELLEERRRHPADDLITRLVAARADGEKLSDAEIVSTIVVLLNAGHEATVNTLGNGLLALMHHPTEWARLHSGDVSASAAIEECIRWDPPLQLFERWVLADVVEVAGVAIPRGEKIAMLFGAANRDPRVFTDPERFDVGRLNAAEHIGFGGGIHSCIGAPLARIELEESLRAIVAGVRQLQLAEEPARSGTFVIWGLDGLHLALSKHT